MRIQFRMTPFSRLCFLISTLSLLMFAAGCVTTWVGEATSIIQLLVPAISAALGILAAFGVGISPTVMAAVQSWANQATTALQTVAGLIDQYSTAEASAQPGILNEIQTALSTVVSNLTTILPELHVNDPSTQAKILAIIEAIQAEMSALINVIPAIQGKVTSHEEMKALVAAVKGPKEFKAEFNTMVTEFGRQYELQ